MMLRKKKEGPETRLFLSLRMLKVRFSQSIRHHPPPLTAACSTYDAASCILIPIFRIFNGKSRKVSTFVEVSASVLFESHLSLLSVAATEALARSSFSVAGH